MNTDSNNEITNCLKCNKKFIENGKYLSGWNKHNVQIHLDKCKEVNINLMKKINFFCVSAYCNYGPSSNCSHFIKFNIGSCLKSKCTNRPVVCNECKCCYWSYNLLTHYNEAHKSIICPIVTSSNEFNLLEKL